MLTYSIKMVTKDKCIVYSVIQCNITRKVRGRRDIKHIIIAIYMATCPRARACIFHKSLGLMQYLQCTCITHNVKVLKQDNVQH